MIEHCDLSDRRACRLVGLARDSYRRPPEAMTKELSSKIVEIAHTRACTLVIGASTTCCAQTFSV